MEDTIYDIWVEDEAIDGNLNPTGEFLIRFDTENGSFSHNGRAEGKLTAIILKYEKGYVLAVMLMSGSKTTFPKTTNNALLAVKDVNDNTHHVRSLIGRGLGDYVILEPTEKDKLDFLITNNPTLKFVIEDGDSIYRYTINNEGFKLKR